MAGTRNGWAPWLLEWTKVKEGIIELKNQAISYGRDPNSLEISLFEESLPDNKTIDEMETAGVKRIILTIFGQSREQEARQSSNDGNDHQQFNEGESGTKFQVPSSKFQVPNSGRQRDGYVGV